MKVKKAEVLEHNKDNKTDLNIIDENGTKLQQINEFKYLDVCQRTWRQ